MKVYKVDTKVIKEASNKLTSLKGECEKYAKLNIPESKKDLGKTHDSINLLNEWIKETWLEIDTLIEKSIAFLSQEAETVDKNDKNGANAVTPSPNTNVNNTANKKIYQKDEIVDDGWRNYGDKSINGFTNYNKKGNCTWYADNRWAQKNPGNPLVFNGGGGNAKNWINSIDKNKFNVSSTSDSNNIVPNSIAVSQSGDYGHVAYVEDVRDGYVYYTEDGEAYTRPHTWSKDENGNWIGPRMQCCTVEEFKRKFANVITSK